MIVAVVNAAIAVNAMIALAAVIVFIVAGIHAHAFVANLLLNIVVFNIKLKIYYF